MEPEIAAAAGPSNPPEYRPRWYHLRPGHFVLLLLAVEGLLWLSQRYRWFPFNEHKGWTVLIAVAAVLAFFGLMLVWWLAALIFRVRFQFSLRSLLLLTVAVAAAFAWLAHEKRQVEEIDRMAGKAFYDFERHAQSTGKKAIPPGPQWMRRILGEHFFAVVISLDLRGTPVTDAALERLKGLTQLQVLILSDTRVTDAGLEHLNGLAQLRILSLNGTQVTGAGLEHLNGLTQLGWLGLGRTQVTDAALAQLKALPQLQVLILSDTKVTDAGLEHLKGLTPLQGLSLHGSEVTDAGMEHLKGLPQLRMLNLDGTQITDAGREHLKGLSQLRLSNYGRKVTPVGHPLDDFNDVRFVDVDAAEEPEFWGQESR